MEILSSKSRLFQDFLEIIKKDINGIYGCAFIECNIKNNLSENIEDSLFSLIFKGWSPSLSEIKISRSWFVRHNDFRGFTEKFPKLVHSDILYQKNRAIFARSLGINCPIRTTGRNTKEIAHVFIDKTGLDFLVKKKGGISEALLEVCRHHHEIHLNSNEYEGFMTIEMSFSDDDFELTQNIQFDGNCVKLEYDLSIHKDIFLVGNFITFPDLNLADSVVESLKTRRLQSLVDLDHPVISRTIKNAKNTINGLRIELEEEYIPISSLVLSPL